MSLRLRTYQGEIDRVKVDEVISFAVKTEYCYKHLVTDYLNNMQRRWVKGTYDRTKVIKLLEYFYSNYVRSPFKREMGYDPALNVKERQVFATYFRDYLENEFLKHIKKPK